MNNLLLEVGDVLWSFKYGSYLNRFIIERVTPTQAISGSTKFKRLVSSNGYAKEIGGSTYNPSYYVETPEIIEKMDYKRRQDKFKNMRFDIYSNEQLKKIEILLASFT